jgi:hypothetical protein
MEGSGQLHAPATLLAGKKPSVHWEQEDWRWDLQPICHPEQEEISHRQYMCESSLYPSKGSNFGFV